MLKRLQQTTVISNLNTEPIESEDEHNLSNQELQRLGQFQRSRSDGLLLLPFSSTKKEFPQFVAVPHTVPTTIIIEGYGFKRGASEPAQTQRRIRKDRKKNLSDYRKNICGYITKKIIRQFTSACYMGKVRQLCQLHDCDYQSVKAFYIGKIEHVTGPSHIPGLLVPEHSSEISPKAVFAMFFKWFLRERYLRYLLLEGKMSDKKAYIDYKNSGLMSVLQAMSSKAQQVSEQLGERDTRFAKNQAREGASVTAGDAKKVPVCIPIPVAAGKLGRVNMFDIQK